MITKASGESKTQPNGMRLKLPGEADGELLSFSWKECGLGDAILGRHIFLLAPAHRLGVKDE
jgi:hypothetical protein